MTKWITGLIFRVFSPNKVAILCFSTGKCIISGARDRQQSFELWEMFFLTNAVHAQSVHDTRNDVRVLDRVSLPVDEVLNDILESHGTNQSKDYSPTDLPTTAQNVYSSLQSISRELTDHITQEPSRTMQTTGLYLPFSLNKK
jgi:TATA-box binding protein (TBP) (component of TFIID and TFIIIB)